MSQKANPTLIGAFTLIGLILVGAAVVLFGAGKYFERSHRILLHFDKSAIGLMVGSDVRFGGVRIGSVYSINVLVDTEKNRKIIPVVVELAEKNLQAIGSTSGVSIDFSSREGVQRAVDRGLRAGMKQQSLLTGLLYIEFDITPDLPGFVYKGPTVGDYPTVPTTATEIDELIAGVADGLKKINALDLDGIVKELKDVLSGARKQVEDLNTKGISENIIAITTDIQAITGDEKLTSAIKNLDDSLAQFKSLATKANDGIDPLMADLTKAADKAAESLTRIEEIGGEISKVANPRGPVLMRLQDVLMEMERASRAIKELANDLKRNPNALLMGKETKE
ncbi:paraquat-inducible protein B [Prosthecobacter fusiformis]|uniref:Paraquat-inducible protein B n=1 Tax=Prosthecobacter fusiformis TaxID=48464 RepID=A0A4R7S3Z4_9BACT|nr:MlaD family protein [Prosthecobacter fusiformis]TDU73024.1 paraquat-inducible protein B [Prosthecobacter fusiformis]